MKYNRLSFLSVFVALGLSPLVGDAAIRVGNAARNNAQGYQQVNTQRYQSEYNTQQQAQAQQPTDLPINVTNQQLAQQIQSGDTNAGVTVEDLETGEQTTYRITGSQEANPMEGKLSDDSPFGRAVVGKGAGEKFTVNAPAGSFSMTVVSVSREG